MIWRFLPTKADITVHRNSGRYSVEPAKDGIVVLQNSVSTQDCSDEKMKRWNEYIGKIWKRPGLAECCFEVITVSYICDRLSET